jgi:hypothetical protein
VLFMAGSANTIEHRIQLSKPCFELVKSSLKSLMLGKLGLQGLEIPIIMSHEEDYEVQDLILHTLVELYDCLYDLWFCTGLSPPDMGCRMVASHRTKKCEPFP